MRNVKKGLVIIIVGVCLLLCQGCLEHAAPKLWILGGTDADQKNEQIYGRFGVEQDGFEFGIESMWQGVKGAGQSYGAYTVGYLEPSVLVDRFYVGYHATVAVDEDGGYYGPIAGVLKNVAGLPIVFEYQFRSFTGDMDIVLGDENEEHTLFGGLQFAF